MSGEGRDGADRLEEHLAWRQAQPDADPAPVGSRCERPGCRAEAELEVRRASAGTPNRVCAADAGRLLLGGPRTDTIEVRRLDAWPALQLRTA